MGAAKLITRGFDKFSSGVIKFTGGSVAFALAFLIVIGWAVTGPVFKFSDTWQLSINSVTSVVTFLMVFILQQSQNKDTLALQLKVNELLAANANASNRLINSEDMTQEELELLKRLYVKMGESVKKEKNGNAVHSVFEKEIKLDDKK